MSRLKVATTTRSFFPNIPYTERKNGENIYPLLVVLLIVIILVFLLPKIQDLIHCLILVGIHVRISKSDVDDGVSPDFP